MTVQDNDGFQMRPEDIESYLASLRQITPKNIGALLVLAEEVL